MVRVRLCLLLVSVVAFVFAFAFASHSAWAQSAATDPADFAGTIRPILSDKCFHCHGPDEASREADLRLDVEEAAKEYAIVAGEPDDSVVLERIESDDPDTKMPPPDSGKSLTQDEIQLIRQWIEQGAPYQSHWSLIPPQRPELPAVNDPEWPQNAIDRFILARLEREGLAPSPEADRVTLLRRVTLDLTGLPPTPEEVDAFLADMAPDAYERVVDRLLRSPRYGEHMARFWLDAARYGDTHGLHLDNYREIWPYRDWVVRAFNCNQPYDQFVTEQLAGDLLPNPTTDQLIATGFNRCNVTTSEGGSIEEEVYVRNVVDRVVTTGTVFLGMTFECTRCHNHKYDPLTMDDFYSLFAFFNSLDGSPLDGNAKDHAPVLRLPTDEQQQRLDELNRQVATLETRLKGAWPELDEQQQQWEQKLREAKPAEGEAAAPAADAPAEQEKEQQGEKVPDEILALIGTQPESREAAQQQQLRDYFREKVAQSDALKQTQDELKQSREARSQLESQIPLTLIWRERKELRPAYLLKRGEYDQQGHQLTRRTPNALPPMDTDLPLDRLGLARWLVDPQHPLTARVAVNRFWQQLFGIGLVKTAEDFGSQGEAPSHPQLLDWLAVQFIEDGWDIKAAMKRMVMSATYRQSSHVTPKLHERDPRNRLLARGPRFRLDAEMLRDQALFVSGLLVEQMGGPSVKPPQPDGLWFAVGYSGSNTVRFVPDQGPDKVHRRTLYTFIKRTSPPPQMSTFDAPSREACTVRRERTNTPLQALLLLNDPQYVEAARALAARTMHEAGMEAESCADHMFRLCVGRHPNEWERQQLVQEFQRHQRTYEANREAAKELTHVGEAPAAGDLAVEQLAAWTMVANLVLNLDEVVNKN